METATVRTMDNNWMSDGRCNELVRQQDERGLVEGEIRVADIMFPSDGLGVKVAQKICAQCVVKQECLEYALENNIDHGVWGGVSERGRRRILRAMRRGYSIDQIPLDTIGD